MACRSEPDVGHDVDLATVRALRTVVWANIGREARGFASAAEIADVVNAVLANLQSAGMLRIPARER